MTQLFIATIDLTKQHEGNPAALRTLFNSLTLITEVFFSLNKQDIPEFFEDHIKEWFERFHLLLTAAPMPALESDDDQKPGLLEELKTQICEVLYLYTIKCVDTHSPGRAPRF